MFKINTLKQISVDFYLCWCFSQHAFLLGARIVVDITQKGVKKCLGADTCVCICMYLI